MSDSRRLLFYILALGFLVMIISAPIAIANGYSKNLSNMIPEIESRRAILLNSSASSLTDSKLDYSIVENFHNLGVKRILPQLLAHVELRFNDKLIPVRVRGVESFETFYADRGIRVNGSTPSSNLEANIGILLSRRLDLGIGDIVEIVANNDVQKFRIVGIVDCGCPCDDELILSLEDLWMLKPSLSDKISFVEVISHDHDLEKLNLSSVKAFLEKPFSQASTTLIQETFNSVRNWAITIQLTILVAAYFTASKISMDSERELVILRSIGATRKKAFVYVFFKSIIVSLLAIITGLSFGTITAQIVFRSLSILLSAESYTPPGLEPFDVLWIVGLSLTSALIGSVYPALKASRRDLGEEEW